MDNNTGWQKYREQSLEELIVDLLKRAGFKAVDTMPDVEYGGHFKWQIQNANGEFIAGVGNLFRDDSWQKVAGYFNITCEYESGEGNDLKKVIDFTVKPGDLFSLTTHSLEEKEVQFCATFTGKEKAWVAFSTDPVRAIVEARLIYLDALLAGVA